MVCGLVGASLATFSGGQTSSDAPKNPPAHGVSASAGRAVNLAQSGHCKEALPLLKQARLHTADKEIERSVGFAGVRCAMLAGQTEVAEDFLRLLNHEFPADPEVLYLSIHTFSDLSSHAAADLATFAPKSAPGHELQAETFESQGKWDEAAKEYKQILELNAHMPGIHFRLGRLLLSKPNPTPEDAEAAKKEMQQEIEIDPTNAGAEYVLGEIAKHDQNWQEAIQHFSRAAKLDAGFGDAYVGWGGALVSEKKFLDAIAPLESAVKLQSGNPAAHYLLAIAYARSGRREDGDREFAIQQKLTQKGAAGETPSDKPQPPN
jgi:tetratricopeptide (TPR) repeat protein